MTYAVYGSGHWLFEANDQDELYTWLKDNLSIVIIENVKI